MGVTWRDRFQADADVSSVPVHTLLDVVTIPTAEQATPWAIILRRFLYASILMVVVSVIVYVDRDGYSEPLTFIDALYYSAVSLSTTGYGDITPVTQGARLMNIFVITPLRIAFLLLLVGTTLSVLTEDSRKTLQIQQWRKTVRNHTIVLGYGTKGRSAIDALLADGASASNIVVVDKDAAVLTRAEKRGLVTVHGNATKSDVLKVAGVTRARSVVVAPSSDDTAVLITLSVRELAPSAMIVASVRESENQHLLMQSGADSVVVSSETATSAWHRDGHPAGGGHGGGPAQPGRRLRGGGAPDWRRRGRGKPAPPRRHRAGRGAFRRALPHRFAGGGNRRAGRSPPLRAPYPRPAGQG